MKYWRVYYEWSWNEYGVDVNFEDTLKQLMIGETWREIEKKIVFGNMIIVKVEIKNQINEIVLNGKMKIKVLR